MVASVGSIPCNPGDLWWCHHNHSFSWWKRARHLLEEEQQVLMVISSSALSRSSPELVSKEGEDPEAKPMVPPLGFHEIARSLTAGKLPEMEIDSPQTRVAQELLVEPTVAMVISTPMCQGPDHGHHLPINCNCLYGAYKLGGPFSGSWLPRANYRGTD